MAYQKNDGNMEKTCHAHQNEKGNKLKKKKIGVTTQQPDKFIPPFQILNVYINGIKKIFKLSCYRKREAKKKKPTKKPIFATTMMKGQKEQASRSL